MDNKEDMAKVIIAFNPIASKIVECIDKSIKAKTLRTIAICVTVILSVLSICFTVCLTLGFK